MCAYHTNRKRPPKPTAYREKIIDKVTDVCNVLTTLSELKCDARLSSGGPSDANQRAVRYACDSKHNPDAKRPILHDWQQLFNGLMQEFTPVCVVLRQLAARCLMAPPNADVDKLTVVVCEFVASHSMRVLRICGDIGFEMEREYQCSNERLTDSDVDFVVLFRGRRGHRSDGAAGPAVLLRATCQHGHLADAYAADVSPAERLKRSADQSKSTNFITELIYILFSLY